MCSTHFGNLASINSAQDQTDIVNVINNAFDDSIDDRNVWIGLNDRSVEGSYSWTDATSYSYSNWVADQPNDYNGAQDCVELRTDYDDKWNDQACDYEVATFVCNQQHSTYESGSYVGVVSLYDTFTWDEANDYCGDKYGSQLASIHDSYYDNQDITTILNELNLYYGWIGLKDSNGDNVYTDNGWIDGTSVTYTNWISGQPSLSSSQCVEVVKDNGARWNDEDCSWQSSGFICNLNVEVSETEHFIGVKWNLGSITWDEANDYCENTFSTSLASVHSYWEREEVYGILDVFDTERGWIGMHYDDNEDDWVWQDGTDVDYWTKWFGGYELSLTTYPNYICVFAYKLYYGNGYVNTICDTTSVSHFVCNQLSTHDDIDDDQTDDWEDYTTVSRMANSNGNGDADSDIDHEYATGVIYDFDDGLSDFGKGAPDDSENGSNGNGNGNGNGSDTSYLIWIVGVLAVLFVVGLVVGSVIWYRKKKKKSKTINYKNATDMEMVDKQNGKEKTTKGKGRVGYSPPQDVEYAQPSADEMMDSEPQKIY